MVDSFLEEQAKRIRWLTERMTQVENERQRSEDVREHYGSGYGPLHDVRDVRVFESPMSERSVARDLSSRRRRRRS